ncbi:FecR domain-containing protein [Pendulispora rubella]|uniref:FecR domain-containing protein n=1 Tax=Pendulispora rubella TaxID=2741070 RepID=A0ABZ2LIF9_9BACT
MAIEPRIDVEPLSESRWARIEGAVFDQLDHDQRVAVPHFIEAPAGSRWRAGAAFVVAGAVAAAIGALVTRAVWHPEPPPAITSQVETGASGTHLIIGEAALDVGPRTALVVNGDDARGVLVVLERGHVEFEVAPRQGRPSFVVQAGEARVSVTGTHFTVDRGGLNDRGVRVEVASGSVEVSTPGEIVNVHAGEQWPSLRENQEAWVVSPLTPPAEPSQTEAPAIPRASRRSAASSTRPPEVDPDDFVSGGNGVLETPEPRGRFEQRTPPQAETPPAAVSPAETQALSRRALFESAARLESSHPATSLSQYGELARGSDPWAANALFAAGRLEADRGMHEAARRTLEEYIARFPRGANAADARDLLNRLKGKPKLP